MAAVVIGAGRLGTAVRRALEQRSVTVRALSRSTGFDVRAPRDLPELGEVVTIIEATDIFTQNREAASDFFVRSTRAVNAAARKIGARHILMSIVNREKPELQGNGYYAGKAEQERVARQEHENLTIVRSTLWFEFARQNLHRMRLGAVAVVPAMTVQPVALDTVAEVIAGCVTGERSGTSRPARSACAATRAGVCGSCAPRRNTSTGSRCRSRGATVRQMAQICQALTEDLEAPESRHRMSTMSRLRTIGRECLSSLHR